MPDVIRMTMTVRKLVLVNKSQCARQPFPFHCIVHVSFTAFRSFIEALGNYPRSFKPSTPQNLQAPSKKQPDQKWQKGLNDRPILQPHPNLILCQNSPALPRIAKSKARIFQKSNFNPNSLKLSNNGLRGRDQDPDEPSLSLSSHRNVVVPLSWYGEVTGAKRDYAIASEQALTREVTSWTMEVVI